jgi:hypothetical protein
LPGRDFSSERVTIKSYTMEACNLTFRKSLKIAVLALIPSRVAILEQR